MPTTLSSAIPWTTSSTSRVLPSSGKPSLSHNWMMFGQNICILSILTGPEKYSNLELVEIFISWVFWLVPKNMFGQNIRILSILTGPEKYSNLELVKIFVSWVFWLVPKNMFGQNICILSILTRGLPINKIAGLPINKIASSLCIYKIFDVRPTC